MLVDSHYQIVLAAKHLIRVLEVCDERGGELAANIEKGQKLACHEDGSLKHLVQPLLDAFRLILIPIVLA